MKKFLTIVILILPLISCKEEPGKENKSVKSEFNLRTDYSDFKEAMMDLDTLKIFVDH